MSGIEANDVETGVLTHEPTSFRSTFAILSLCDGSLHLEKNRVPGAPLIRAFRMSGIEANDVETGVLAREPTSFRSTFAILSLCDGSLHLEKNRVPHLFSLFAKGWVLPFSYDCIQISLPPRVRG
jgi:hypothetical protein